MNEPDIPTLLVLGSSGQVGFELRRSLAPLGRLVTPTRSECDLSCPDDLWRVMRTVRPDAVICAAAFTDVDAAETRRDEAHAVNAVAPAILASAAAETGALLVHYSSDYVFDGTKHGPYTEIDTVHPLSVYGQSKADGEAGISASGARHLILRTSWVYGIHGQNFARTILRAARAKDRLRVVSDQVGAPTPAALVADVTAHVIRMDMLSGGQALPSGIFHVAAAGETSWHEYAVELLTLAAARGIPMRVALADVVAIGTAEYPAAARRPANSRLDTALLTSTFGLQMPHWRDGVVHLLDQLSDLW